MKPLIRRAPRLAQLTILLIPVLLTPMLALEKPEARSCPSIGPGESYTLTSNETWDCVKVQGSLSTGIYTLTITAPGGLGVHDDGKVYVDTNGTIILAGGGNCEINGFIQLCGDGSTLKIGNNTTFCGNGEVRGRADDALIEISASKVLTSQIDVVGRMQIEGKTGLGDAGKFVNEDMVNANVNTGIIEFMANTIVEDSGTVDADDFKATGGGILRFSVSATALKARFVIEGSGSKLLLGSNINVHTCGSLLYNGGCIDVTGGTFEYVGYSGTCTNPADSGSGADCNNRYVVSSDDTCS